MDRHKITRALIEEHDVGEDIFRHDEPLFSSSRVVAWRRKLAIGIARVNQCQTLTRAGTRGVPNTAQVTLVGRKSDMDVTRYLYGYLSREIERLAKEAIRGRQSGEGRIWGNNFRTGAVITVCQRLQEARDQARRSAQEDLARQHGAEQASRALVLVTDHDKHVAEFVNQHWKGHYQPSSTLLNRDGLVAGMRAGATISLHDALQEVQESVAVLQAIAAALPEEA
jgi:hypothetical protein